MKRSLAQLLMVVVLVGAVACKDDGDDDWTPIAFDDDGESTKGKKKKKKRQKEKPEATAERTPEKPKPTTSAADRRAAELTERGDKAHLRKRARTVHGALVAALPAKEKKLVENIPFVIDTTAGSVNAFAACLKDGRALVAVTDGLMQIQSQLARAKATDETFGTNKLDAYLSQLSRSRDLLPPKNFISKKHDADPRKRARQALLLDEGLAFVIGHELAHHRLSHTGCIGDDRGAVTPADLGRFLSRKVPLFNQPNELASDVYGIQNVLQAGKDGKGWKEDGALLMLRAFRARTRQSLQDSLKFGFERTHPHPDLRIPVVQQTARTWRLSGGRSLPKLPNVRL